MCAQMTSAAPAKAPASMAATAIRRRPALDPCRLDRVLSAAMPVMVRVSTVVVRSGTASVRAAAFWMPLTGRVRRSRVTVRGGDRVVAQARQDDRDGEEDGLHACGGAE
jgi:hypothetical protein